MFWSLMQNGISKEIVSKHVVKHFVEGQSNKTTGARAEPGPTTPTQGSGRGPPFRVVFEENCLNFHVGYHFALFLDGQNNRNIV